MPKSLSQRLYGAALPPHTNAEIVISAENCFNKHALRDLRYVKILSSKNA